MITRCQHICCLSVVRCQLRLFASSLRLDQLLGLAGGNTASLICQTGYGQYGRMTKDWTPGGLEAQSTMDATEQKHIRFERRAVCGWTRLWNALLKWRRRLRMRSVFAAFARSARCQRPTQLPAVTEPQAHN